MYSKMTRVCIMLLLLTLALLPGIASAQGPTGSFASGIACLNLGTATAQATIDFYNTGGTKVANVINPAFEPNKPWLLFTPNISSLGSGFSGSAVVNSAQQAACSVNTQTNGGTQRVGTSEGLATTELGPKAYATQIVNALGNFNSYVSIQNAGAASTKVKARYLNAAGAEVFTQEVDIPANSSKIFYQEQAGLPVNFIGSAIFEATDGTTPLAGAVALYNTATAQLLSFNTVKGGASKVFLPRLAKNLSGVGYTSGFACQNIGPGPVDMKMDISMLDQDTKAIVAASLSKAAVGEGQSWLGFFGSPTGTAIDAINKGFGSGIVTTTSGTGKVACTVNEDNRTVGSNLNGQGSTVAGVPDGKQTKKMFFSQIVALGVNSFRGGFQIANTTATDTTCTYTFSNGDVLSNQSLKANSSNSVFAEAVLTNNKTNFNGSVRVECGEAIVGIYNLTVQGPAAAGDPFATNSGINQQ